MIGLIGNKSGMTRIFTEDGKCIPVTLIEIKENYISQIKTLNKDGYNAIQVAYGLKKRNRIKKSIAGHLANAGISVGKIMHEFRIFNLDEYEKYIVGQNIKINIFSNIKKVDVIGITKGKGFSGTIKRWNFSSQDATHGNSLSHRVPGSIGQNQTPGRVFKGKKMPGQLGNTKVTILNLDLIKIDEKNNFLLVKGAVPGAIGTNLIIRQAIKNYINES